LHMVLEALLIAVTLAKHLKFNGFKNFAGLGLEPRLGPIIGPAGNFAPLPDGAKWLLAFGMLLGRLEFFTVLVVLSPSFWRR
jgi:Trk-type K+ transport system membrane component